jgi:hypothetical protein
MPLAELSDLRTGALFFCPEKISSTFAHRHSPPSVTWCGIARTLLPRRLPFSFRYRLHFLYIFPLVFSFYLSIPSPASVLFRTFSPFANFFPRDFKWALNVNVTPTWCNSVHNEHWQLHLSLDLWTSDLRIFATTNHVNLHLFSNLRTLFSLQRRINLHPRAERPLRK